MSKYEELLQKEIDKIGSMNGCGDYEISGLLSDSSLEYLARYVLEARAESYNLSLDDYSGYYMSEEERTKELQLKGYLPTEKEA